MYSDGVLMQLTSSICECKIVATAFMMSSTLGFSRVEPTNIELIVDDFLSSIISPLSVYYFDYYKTYYKSFTTMNFQADSHKISLLSSLLSPPLTRLVPML